MWMSARGLIEDAMGVDPCRSHHPNFIRLHSCPPIKPPISEFDWQTPEAVPKLCNLHQRKMWSQLKSSMPVQAEDVKSSISCITDLCKEILINVPIGNRRSKIYLVMTGDEGEDSWHTFNKQFDALFAEDCRDGQDRLHHICRGEFGMDLVV
jgi:hypothetical protein